MRSILRVPFRGAVALLFAVCAFAAPSLAQDTVVATVNGKPIKERDIAYAEAEIGPELRDLPQESKRRVLLEYVIENQLLADAAEAEKLGEAADYQERLKYWQRRALRDAYFDKSVKGEVGEGMAKVFYDEQVKQLKPEEEVQARHILVEKEELAKELAAKITGGGDFAALAKEHSKDPGSKEDGGMLGFFARGQMVPAFENAAFGLQKGQVSNPIQTQFGWHIIKLEDRRNRAPPSFDQVKDRIMTGMISQKAQAVAGDLRTKGKIEYIDPEIKKQVEEQAKQAEAQKSGLEKQMKEQIEKMEAETNKAGEPKKEAEQPKYELPSRLERQL